MKTSKDINTSDLYKLVKDKLKLKKFNQAKFRKFLKELHTEAYNFSIDNPEGITLPYLGTLYIQGIIPRDNDDKKFVDWIQAKKLHKKVYLFNDHTGGINYKWKLSFPTTRSIYTFKANRALNRYLKHIIYTTTKYIRWYTHNP